MKILLNNMVFSIMLMKFTKAINIYENKVCGLTNGEYDYQKKLLKAKPKIYF